MDDEEQDSGKPGGPRTPNHLRDPPDAALRRQHAGDRQVQSTLQPAASPETAQSEPIVDQGERFRELLQPLQDGFSTHGERLQVRLGKPRLSAPGAVSGVPDSKLLRGNLLQVDVPWMDAPSVEP